MNTGRTSHPHRTLITLLIGCTIFLLAATTSYSLTPPSDTLEGTPIYFPIIVAGPSDASNCNPTGGSRGLAPGRYRTTVAGLNATVVVGQGYDPRTPTYLAFFLHGDNGSWTKFLSTSNPVTKFVNQQGWIFVAAQSPNDGESWWTHWSGDHNQAFSRVLDEMFAKYNVCRDMVFGSSGSGGSEFWTSHFFPAKGAEYPAHTVIGCGGNDGYSRTSRQQVSALGRDPDVVRKSTFEYVYGTEDYLYRLVRESITLYTNAGFNVYVHEMAGAGHCNEWPADGFPDLSTQIATYWAKRAAALGAD